MSDSNFFEAMIKRAKSMETGLENFSHDHEARFYPEPVGYAQTVYIDPGWDGENPDGSKEKPFKSWVGATSSWRPSTAYLQKAGTVADEVQITAFYNTSDIYIGAYGTGLKPVLHGTINGAEHESVIQIQRSSNFTVENLNIRVYNGQNGINVLPGAGDVNNLRIQGCIFDIENNPDNSRTVGAAIRCYASPGYALKNSVIAGNEFTGTNHGTADMAMRAILFYHDLPSPCNIDICENYFHDTVMDCIVFSGMGPNMGQYEDENGNLQSHGLKGESPKGIRINDNIFINIGRSPIVTSTGMLHTTEYPSFVRGNIMKNIGNWESRGINAMQLQWLQNVDVSYNYIDTVITSKPDGAAIILDWAQKLADKPTMNSRVHHNICCNCRSSEVISGVIGGGGIALYICENTWAYSNYCFNTSSGISCSNGGEEGADLECAGNKIFNNTLMFNTAGVRLTKANAPLVANNAIIYNTLGVYNAQTTSYDVRGNAFFCNKGGHASGMTLSRIDNKILDKALSALDTLLPPKQAKPESRKDGWIMTDSSPLLGAANGAASLAEYADASIDTASFGLNGAGLSTPPSVGCYQG